MCSDEADPLLTDFVQEITTIRDFTTARHTTIFLIEGSLTPGWRAETLTSARKPTYRYVGILSYTVLKAGMHEFFTNLVAAPKF